MKRHISLALALVFVLTSLSSCSQSSETADSATATATTETATSAEPVVATTEDSDTFVVKDSITPETLGSGTVKWSEVKTTSGYMLVTNEGGETLGYTAESGLSLIQVDGYAFKDMNKNGLLDQYEDWRETDEDRAQSLAATMPMEEIFGLFLHSIQQGNINEITESQAEAMDSGLRSFLNSAPNTSPVVSAQWNNDIQAYVEAKDYVIPVEISSDPRETGVSSLWPKDIGIAATFDPDIAQRAGEVMSTEHRLMGISTFLKPLASIITDPRHYRYEATYGEDPLLVTEMVSAMINGIQSTYDEDGTDLGWGEYSMIGMAKRWPGNGSPEGGRSGHAKTGWLDVFPGDAQETQLIPFVDGAFELEGETEMAMAIMASFSAWETDPEIVGAAFSDYKINYLLRERYDYEGVACSDWKILTIHEHGVEDLTEVEQVYKAIMAGLDQIGGWESSVEIAAAYDMLVDDYGQETIDERFRGTALRVLRNKFLTNLFDNPYTDLEETAEIVGNDEFRAEALEAQLKSIIMLKNENGAIQEATSDEKPTVYVPMVYSSSGYALPYDESLLKEYFNLVTDTPASVLTGPEDENGNPTVAVEDVVRASAAELATIDFAMPVMDGPINTGNYQDGYGYNMETMEYIPISLQYGPYTADSEYVREVSRTGAIIETEIQGAYAVEIVQEIEDRNYYGEDAVITNPEVLDMILWVIDNVPEGVPIITVLEVDKPMIVGEFEAGVDAILVSFTADPNAILQIVTGQYEPSALLPSQWPADMIAVEKQYEDLPRDMDCYVDSAGNVYDFAYGMNWSGVIYDERVEKYSAPAQMTPNNVGNVD